TSRRQPEPDPGLGPDAGSARLVSVQELPEIGDMCFPEFSSAANHVVGAVKDNLFDAFEETSAHAAAEESGDTTDVTRPPVRTIRDSYPIYSSIAVDTQFNEVALQDTNLFGIKIFNSLDNNHAAAVF